MNPTPIRALVLLTMALAPVLSAPAADTGQVNVYSARKEVLIRPLLDRFTAETGIEVRLLSASSGALLTRLENEGRNTPADLLLTVDAGNLHRAREAGVLQPVQDPALDERVPSAYRDPDGHWYGLSLRARVIFRAAERVKPGAIESYEQLADPAWKGRICVRSSDSIYNQSLVASLIEHRGEAATERWGRGLVDNFARRPQGGDRDQIKAVAAGECDLAIANTYYYGRMLDDAATRKIAEQVELVWPNQDGRGAHVNVSGAGVTRHAAHPDAARRLLVFLLGRASQRWYAQVNNEYPVRPDVQPGESLRQWGHFKADELNLSHLGEHNADAVRLMDRVGWR